MPPQKRVPRSPAKVTPIKRAPRGPSERPEPDGRKEKIRIEGRMAQFMRGELTIEDMDWEELSRGQFRDRNGGFTGRKPRMVPREFAEECTRELLKRANQRLTDGLDRAIDAMIDIAGSPTYDAKDRIAAGKVVFERVLGKTPDKLEVKAKVTRFEAMLDKVIWEEGDEE